MTHSETADTGSLGELAVQLALGGAALARTRAGELTGGVAGGIAGGIAGSIAGADIRTKSTDTDLVTDVDRTVERWLVRELAARRPGDAVLGEEDGARAGANTGVRWLLDPIDGTVNFVLGLPQYAVSVAVEVEGIVVAGAVSNPASGETFHAVQGAGAFLTHADRQQRLHGPREVPLHRAVVGTGFGYDARLRTRQLAVIAPLVSRVADLRRLGSAAMDLCFVAAGRLDGYFEAGLNPWDWAAGALIAAEAGATVTGLRGAPISADMVVAAGASFAADLIGQLETLDADRVGTG